MISGVVVAINILVVLTLVFGIIVSAVKKFVLGIIAFSLILLPNIFYLLMPMVTDLLIERQGMDAINVISALSSITGLLELAAYILLIIGIFGWTKRKKQTVLSNGKPY